MCHSEPGNLTHNMSVFWRHFIIIFDEYLFFLQFGDVLHEQGHVFYLFPSICL